MREHLRTALVVTDTGEVLSTWDRLTCGPIPDYTPPPHSAWPTGSVVVLDATTGEVVESFLDTSAEPQVTVTVDAARDGLTPDAVPKGYHLVEDYVRSGGAEPTHVYATDDYEAHVTDPQHPRGPLVAVRLAPIPAGARQTQPPPPEGIDVFHRPDIAEGAVMYVESGGAGPQ